MSLKISKDNDSLCLFGGRCGLLRRFDNICLGYKLLLAPCLILLAVLFLAWIGWVTIAAQRDSLSYIVETVFEQRSKVGDLRSSFDATDARLTRLLLLANGGASEEKIKDAAKAIDGSLLGLDGSEKKLQESMGKDSVNAQLLADISVKLKAYRKHVKEVVAFVDMDASTALGVRMNNENVLNEAVASINSLEVIQDEQVVDSYRAVQTKLQENIKLLSIVLIATFLISMILSGSISHFLGERIRQIITITVRLAGGEKTIQVPGTMAGDEVGEMARAVEILRTNALEMDRLTAEQEEQKKRAAVERREAMLKMADDFEASVRGVVSTVSSAATEMQSNAQSMATIAEETSRQSTAVAAAAEEASSNVGTVASAAEELNASIAEINRQIGDSVRVAGEAMREAASTSNVMQGLHHSADEIGNIVKLIENIAHQVNLLALNATIEAARAGEAGKGFAVVATEVKNLANQAGSAAQDITNQIGEVQAQTNRAVQAIEGITRTIKQVNEISTAIAAAVQQQGGATQEIARNVQQASQGTDEVTRNITGVTRAATETGHASNQVLDAAAQLAHESETLRAVVDGFVAKVRAG